ncbi:hypothetical protein E2C01_057160 [Portunus trituberculatus]|uniref:Uncharacterized protein n=1 Tax=Portunus trituberculatus TaxID=210409 RepID=A0A5B7GZN2_PORTR|nr:hypothetical protein [Portunus trituberculatus]
MIIERYRIDSDENGECWSTAAPIHSLNNGEELLGWKRPPLKAANIFMLLLFPSSSPRILLSFPVSLPPSVPPSPLSPSLPPSQLDLNFPPNEQPLKSGRGSKVAALSGPVVQAAANNTAPGICIGRMCGAAGLLCPRRGYGEAGGPPRRGQSYK